MSYTATYVSTDTFTVSGDVTDKFIVTERVAVDCNGTLVYSSIESASYGAGVTTVVLTQAVLSSPCGEAYVSGIYAGASGNLPVHDHSTDDQGGTGVIGSSAQYEWSGTQIRFKNPDGSWGSWVELSGVVWHGAWTTVTSYVTGDVVENDGSGYICTSAHTSGATSEPGTGVYWETYWDLVVSKGDTGATGATGATGTTWNWHGPWVLSHAYVEDDGVENDGSSYICTTGHTSDSTSEPGVGTYWETYWDVVASKGDTGSQGIQGIQGIQGETGAMWNWTGIWVDSTLYGSNDGAENDGSSYICTVEHTSDTTTEPGVGTYWETYWDLVASKGDTGSQGIQGTQGTQGIQGVQGNPAWVWHGAWVLSHPYVEDDGAENDGSSYICTTGHTSDSTNEPGTGVYWETYWDLVASKGDTGSQGIQGIQGIQGPTGTAWTWHGAWVESHAYVEDDGVENDGSSYICTTGHTSDVTTEPGVGTYWETYWDLVVEKGDTGIAGAGVAVQVGTNTITDGTLQFANSNGITFGMNGSTITASISATGGGGGSTISMYEPYVPTVFTVIALGALGNTWRIEPFMLQEAGDFNLAKFLFSVTAYDSLSFATSANTTFTFQDRTDCRLMVYSRGTGAGSEQLNYVTSTVAPFIIADYTFSCAGIGTQWSWSCKYQFNSGTDTTATYSTTMSSATNVAYAFNQGNALKATLFTANRFLNVPFGFTLNPGYYWLAFNLSTTTAGDGPSSMTKVSFDVSQRGITNTQYPSNLGETTSVGALISGQGIFSIAAGASTSLVELSNITSQGSNIRQYFQFAKLG